jgi:NhaP-type Na+/H+ or K+/H+ antiporter
LCPIFSRFLFSALDWEYLLVVLDEIGGTITYILKRMNSLNQNPIYETFYIIIGAYLSYALAHLSFFQLSGDVAIFFFGVFMSHYNKYNMSPSSFKNIGLTFNMIMQFAEVVCFIYIGVTLEDALVGHSENIVYALVCLGVLLAMRVIVVSIVACFASKNFSIKGKEWLAVISSGMIKGPMAYIFGNVLVPDRVPCLDVKDHHQYDKSFPLFVLQITVLISLVVLTPLNHLVFKLTVSKEAVEDKTEDETRTTSVLKKSLLKDEWVLDKNKPKVFTYVDEFLLKPLFIRDYFQRKVLCHYSA